MRFVLLALLLSASLGAQAIDRERSGFASAPNGREGCYAPFRVVITDLAGVDSVRVEARCRDVSLYREVATGGRDEARVLVPLLVSAGASIRIGDDVWEPPLPLRRLEADYRRNYVAVFSPDPVAAHYVLPGDPTLILCDHFELTEFFDDWRLLDGYDAVVIFNPSDARLPPGSQRAIAEFSSLGGAVLIAGSFRLGEQAQGLPAPAEPTLHTFSGVDAQRFGYGPGAIYRIGWDALRRGSSAQATISDALLHHAWHGGDTPPGGKRPSRATLDPPRLAPPLPPAEARPSPWFFGLAGGLILLCALGPLLVSRLTARTWAGQLVVVIAGAAIGAAALMQGRPQPVVEVAALVVSGDGEAASARLYALGMADWQGVVEVNLADTATRYLPRPLASQPGWRAWQFDLPLAAPPRARSGGVLMEGGGVDGMIYRDFAASAHRGQTEFSTDQAWLLEWWLDGNAYRGRRAKLSPLESPETAVRFDGARVVVRGAIGVTR